MAIQINSFMQLLTFTPSYIFDARNFGKALNIQKGHVAAVMDVEFSPTGEELVSGSYV
jgi:WD40 repeat protein